ncbi:MAG: hypothetical protein EAZ62_07075, partial [Sphingobacteriia bacterium]
MKKNILSSTLIFCQLAVFCLNGAALPPESPVKTYPLNWFAGMAWNKVQIIVQAPFAFGANTTFKVNYPGITLAKQVVLPNPQYA